MAMTENSPSDDKLSALWHAACTDYAKETGTPLVAGELSELRGPEDLSRHLENEKDNFQDFRMKRRPLLHAMQTVIAPFETWGGLIAVTSFPPASTIMSAMLLLVRGVRKVSEAFDMITAMFRKLGHFALRLESYRGVPLSEGMKVIIVKVLVNFLRVCAASQKLVSRGSFKARLTQWAKSTFLEDGEVGRLLGELEELTSQEHMMVSAHGLKLTNQALKNTEELLERENRRNDRERLQRVKAALSPVPGSSQIFSSINESRIPGSGAWVEERLRSWWEGSEPILWLHGGPGVGKSFLASKIITELSKGELSAGPAPVVASFFCRNNDVDLRSLNKALRTLAWQVVAQREDFAAHAEEFCLKEDVENSYAVWRKLLLDYLAEVPAQGTCLVIDGIDEAEPEEQEILCSLLEKTFSEEDMSRPPLRVVMLSRDSLRGLLDEHSLAWIDEVEVGNNQNKDDLHGYVADRLQKTKLFRGSPDFQEEIVKEISREAEGLWEWANLVIKSVLRCRTKEQIRKGIKTMPRGISAMLTQELQRLGRELSVADEMSGGEESEGEGATQIDQLNIVLSFVTLAQKPLTVTQLELILEIIFKEEVLNLEDDLRTIYSSLFLLRADEDAESFSTEGVNVVVLRHSSFYEFFRSSQHSGPVGVNVDQAQVNFLYAFFYALREDRTPTTEKWTDPLREYAQNFLPTHLKEANPEKAGKLHGKISALVDDLFTKEECSRWFLENMFIRNFTQYCFYATSDISKLGEFWLDLTDRELVNKRAEMALQWLLPETKQAFQEHAHASKIASDVCPFTVLFSHMAEYWYRLWLEPQQITDGDGSPATIPALLAFYNDMVSEYSKDAGSREHEITVPVRRSRDAPAILAVAELHGHEQTPLWHARVAQGLLLNSHYAEARASFRFALAEQEKTPTFDPPSLFVIHRDLGRACAEIGRHVEALEHHEISESLVTDAERSEAVPSDSVSHLLNAARLKYRAKRTQDAVETANKAWDLAIKRDSWWSTDFESFFNIFLELHQPQRLRPVLDRASEFYEVERTEQYFYKDLADFLFKQLTYITRTTYRLLQYVLTPNDGEHLDRVVAILEKIDTLERRREDIPIYKYLMATVLFSKGRVNVGLDGWCQVLIATGNGDFPRWDIKYPQARAAGQLVTVCLEHPAISPCERCPMTLGSDEQIDETCLIISAWLRKQGDIANARDVLRWRVKHCIALLSDDDIGNDEDAFKSLFRTFVADPDSDADREAALYWIKASQERFLGLLTEPMGPQKANEDAAGGVSETWGDSNNEGTFDVGDVLESKTWKLADDLSECSSCREGISYIHFWYFCRACPYTTLCRRCYTELQSADHPSVPLTTCISEHEFCFTGGLVRPSEVVDEGMVPLISAEGERQVIWVEEWKDRLADKWKTNDFEFEGGLSAWCMRVLPEPQRTRWAAFFQT
ncbi:hypothetical protein BJX68DRAFT_240245 [Aspergillus pseudodeflectus]|uniref:NACHT domain-containing protein n=1 Tax=Aspergillus pseudodeflectus TaxID=176178 RepID=A0ABR4K7E0_9EURO